MQISSLIDLDVDKMLITGLGNGYLHDLTDLRGLKAGHLLTVKAGDASSVPAPSSQGLQHAAQHSPAAAGAITKEALAAALFAATKPKSKEEVERQRAIQDMQARILSSAQHVMIYENPQVCTDVRNGSLC
jgi:hypothetical protein